jgi:hypothetical protein
MAGTQQPRKRTKGRSRARSRQGEAVLVALLALAGSVFTGLCTVAAALLGRH